MHNYFLEYLEKIESKEIIAPKKVIKIYSKLKEELEDPNSLFIFDNRRANRPIEFIETFCKHSKGKWAGKPVKLELFQKAFISVLFGIVYKETGLRRFKQAFFMVGRKNGKSTMLAGIALYMLTSDGEAGAEVYTLATKLDQAKLIFDEVLRMVQQSPELKNALTKRRTHLEFMAKAGKIQPLSNKSNTLDGLNTSCAIIDELHAIKDRDTYEVMYQSMASRDQPLLIMITTAGTVRENIFDQIYHYGNGILDGSIHDYTFLPVIYELDEKEEWKDPNSWIKANPALGVIKNIKDLQDKVNKAKQDSSDLSGLLTKDFNIRENAVNRWLDFEAIDKKGTFNIEDFKGSWFIGGVDLSSVNDLTCATALFMEKDTERICIEQMYWIPESKLNEHLQKDKVPYDVWKRKGYLRTCENNIVDFSLITEWFKSLVTEKNISPLVIYYDRWQSSYWVEEMQQNGFKLTPCAQGAKTFTTPMKHLEADLKTDKIAFNNNPILKWCLSNVDLEIDKNENIRPIKGGTQNMRIDGTVSLINAYVGLLDHYQEFKELI